ncbi:MAG: hypothetical protein GY795_22865 [Desulfobacterales bacterium]|nr:hypothetical protein [Desulfobacterales bacterium]
MDYADLLSDFVVCIRIKIATVQLLLSEPQIHTDLTDFTDVKEPEYLSDCFMHSSGTRSLSGTAKNL